MEPSCENHAALSTQAVNRRVQVIQSYSPSSCCLHPVAALPVSSQYSSPGGCGFTTKYRRFVCPSSFPRLFTALVAEWPGSVPRVGDRRSFPAAWLNHASDLLKTLYWRFCQTLGVDRIVGLVVKAPASRAEDPGFESRLRRDFFGVESYQ